MAANPPLPGPATAGMPAAGTNLATRPGNGAGAAPGANGQAVGALAAQPGMGASPGGGLAVAGQDGQNGQYGGGQLSPLQSGGLATASPIGSLSNLRDVMQQPAVRRAMPAIIVALVLFVFFAIYSWMQSPVHRTVLPGMSEADTQAAFESLRSANFSPVIDQQTGQLRVMSHRYHEARIHLAAQGIPKGAATGIQSLKDQSSMTTSQFMEQVRYVAAIEQELARSVVQIATIQNARVHLALPRQSAFVRERVSPKASVVVLPYPGRVVSPAQVRAIVHLVSSSVPYLPSENVSIIDDTGRLLTDTTAEQALGLTSAQTEHKRMVEETYRNRILQLLQPLVGEENVRTQVNLLMDFTQEESTFEDFDRRQTGPRTRSEVLAEDKTQRLEPQGVPGALANTPPADGTFSTDGKATAEPGTGAQTISTRQTRNYELDRAVRHVKSATGNIQRVSVSVVINDRLKVPAANGDKPGEKPADKDAKANGDKPAEAAANGNGSGYTQAELDRLVELVRGVVGFDAARGDVVALVPARFEPPTPMEPVMPWYESHTLMEAVKSAVAALVFMLILLVVVRPVMRSFMGPSKAELEAAQAAAAAAAAESADDEIEEGVIEVGEGETLEAIKARLKPRKSTISADMLDTANTYDDKVAIIRMLVADDSGRVANVLKGMIKPNS